MGLEERRQDLEDLKSQEKNTIFDPDANEAISMLGLQILPDEEYDKIIKQKDKENKRNDFVLMRDKFLEQGGIPEWCLDNYDSNLWQQGFNAAISVAKSKKNGLLCGPSDIGKSHLAVAIAWFKIEHYQVRPYRLNEINLHRAWMRSLNSDSQELKEIVLLAKKCEFLIYDELGKFRLTDGKIEGDSDGEFFSSFGGVVYDIANHRAERDKQTVVTIQASNQQQLLERVGYSILRRFMRTKKGVDNCIKAIYKK